MLSWLSLQLLPSPGDGVSTKSGEVGRKGEVGGREVSRRENFGGNEEAEKTKNSGQGRMCFWFIPKMASTASSSTCALVAAGSLQPFIGISQQFTVTTKPVNIC
jgi:hypothetical protein